MNGASRPRPWLELLAAIAVALLLRAIGADETGAGDGAPQLAFFGWLAGLFVAIWQGINTVSSTVGISWVLNHLWIAIQFLWNHLKEWGEATWQRLKHPWKFLKDTYNEVLKPAWEKFWRLVDTVRRTLERVLGPVIRRLLAVRKWLFEQYDRFVRPILDTIGVARQVLRVFATLGLDWARALDRKLGTLEEKIDAPFRYLVAQLNEVIGVINRIVTLDGLLQRLALLRSVERDMRFLKRAFANWRSADVTEEEKAAQRARMNERTPETVRRDTEEALLTKEGRYGPLIREMDAQWRIYLNVR